MRLTTELFGKLRVQLRFAGIALALSVCAPVANSAAETITEVFLGGETHIGVSGSPPQPKVEVDPCFEASRFRPSNPFGVECSPTKTWFTTVGDSRIWQQSRADDQQSFQICLVAGSGKQGYAGDGGSAVDADFNWPHEVRADHDENLFVADTRNHVIRRIDHKTGIVTTIAGNGKNGFAGDGKSGGDVQFNQPHSIALDHAGGLLVADTKNHRLRLIDLETGIVQTVSGTGEKKLPVDGAKASTSPLFGPRTLAVDDRSIWIALREGNSIWRIDRAAGTIHHIAGTGKKGYTGDGGPAREATFAGPKGIAIDGNGNLMVVDTENHAVRRIDMKSNTVSTVLGGSLANETFPMKRPHGVGWHPMSKLLVADSENNRVLVLRDDGS